MSTATLPLEKAAAKTAPVMSTSFDDLMTVFQDLLPELPPDFANDTFFAGIVWVVYALRLCGNNMEMCANEVLLQMPLQMLSHHGPRVVLFEYLWCYISCAQIHKAMFKGIPMTFEVAQRLSCAWSVPEMGATEKNKLYAWAFASAWYRLVLRPLLVLYIARDLGQYISPEIAESDAATFTALGLYGLRIVLGNIEQECRSGGWITGRSTGVLYSICVLGTAISLMVLQYQQNDTKEAIELAWAAAQEFGLRGDHAGTAAKN